MPTAIRDNPALVGAVVQAVIALIVAFGVDISAEQTAAILGFAALASGLLVRSKVTPAYDVLWDPFPTDEDDDDE
jgi:hypothetical protein